jgi:hypothetical protein
MASRRGTVTLVAVLLIVVACTNGGSGATQPTAPPDAFASTPTIGGIPTTTVAPPTTIDTGQVILQLVDAVSLQPVTSFDPIPLGDYLGGSKISPDGRYLAAQVYKDSGANQLHLIDLHSWLPVATWPEPVDWIVDVDESGSVFFFTHRAANEFRLIAVDGTESTPIVTIPPEYSIWGADRVSEAVFVVYGSKQAEPASGDPEQVFVATIDLDEPGTMTEIPLPGVSIGAVDPISQGPWASYLYNVPSFTWDRIGSSLLVTHADADVVSTVDPVSGEVTDHAIEGTVDLGSGSRRYSAISPDGRLLYIATMAVALIEDDDDWSVRTSPAGVTAVDTTTWQMAGRTDEPISTIWVSPNGSMLGSGYSTEESETVYLEESTGLYLLDPTDLSVRVHYPPESPDHFWGSITFTEAGSIAYATTWLNTPRVDAIDMATGEFIATVEGGETLEMIGPARVLARSG